MAHMSQAVYLVRVSSSMGASQVPIATVNVTIKCTILMIYRLILDGLSDGEVWYELCLQATNPEIVFMPSIECEVGRYIIHAYKNVNVFTNIILITKKLLPNYHFKQSTENVRELHL